MCNADQCRSMCDQCEINIEKHFGSMLEFDHTLIPIDWHGTLIHHVLLSIETIPPLEEQAQC